MFLTASILKSQKWQKNVRTIYSFTDSAVTAIIQLASTVLRKEIGRTICARFHHL